MTSSKNNVEVKKDKVQELFKNYYNPREVINGDSEMHHCYLTINKKRLCGNQNGIMETT